MANKVEMANMNGPRFYDILPGDLHFITFSDAQ